MVHSYGAPIKTRDCPRQIEPIFQEHLSRAPLLFSSIRLGAEKRLETFSFRQQEKREREHPPPPPRPVQCPSSSRGGRRRTRRWRSCLIVQRGFVARQMPRTEAPPAAPPPPFFLGREEADGRAHADGRERPRAKGAWIFIVPWAGEIRKNWRRFAVVK